MYKVVLLRHGESIWNAQNKFTGWVDIELSEKGREQAKNVGLILKEKGFVFDIAFTSVLKRAIETLEITLEAMGLLSVPIEKAWQLNERHYGALQGVEREKAVEKFGLEQVMAWRRGYKTKPPHQNSVWCGGKPPALVGENPSSESLEDVFLRVAAYWKEKITPAILEGKNILIVAHGNSLRALVKMLDNISDKDIENLNIPIGIPLVYELNGGLTPTNHYYLADKNKVEEAIEAVKNEVK
ncbi:MAG: 2,3-diphosphoglycerate-dependent phosphoglycerate mutase [Candidatus Pacebacteria bacterium]|nr:2,3-diphosphoglycerate-dependent phosphoglycerate mutase [Candidatus Paceibacterota bacterium]